MKNSFDVPHGSAGKRFVAKLAWLFCAIGEGSSLESIALMTVLIVCVLIVTEAISYFQT